MRMELTTTKMMMLTLLQVNQNLPFFLVTGYVAVAAVAAAAVLLAAAVEEAESYSLHHNSNYRLYHSSICS